MCPRLPPTRCHHHCISAAHSAAAARHTWTQGAPRHASVMADSCSWKLLIPPGHGLPASARQPPAADMCTSQVLLREQQLAAGAAAAAHISTAAAAGGADRAPTCRQAADGGGFNGELPGPRQVVRAPARAQAVVAGIRSQPISDTTRPSWLGETHTSRMG